MADPMSDEPLRDRIAGKLAEWAFQAAETKGVKLTSFHRHIIEQEAPERADMVMEVVRPEVERLRAELDTERRRNHYRRAEQAEQRRARAVAEVARLATDRDRARTALAHADKRVEELTVLRDGLRAEVAEVEAERDEARTGQARLADDMERLIAEVADERRRVRALHQPVCGGACGLDDACECQPRDLVCAECNERWPCGTIRALDGTEKADA